MTETNKKHKFSTYILLILGTFLIITAVGSALDTDDIDDICAVDDSILYRIGGQWVCAYLNDVVTFTNMTIINNQTVYESNVLNTTGNAYIGGNTTSNYYYGNGSYLTGIMLNLSELELFFESPYFIVNNNNVSFNDTQIPTLWTNNSGTTTSPQKIQVNARDTYGITTNSNATGTGIQLQKNTIDKWKILSDSNDAIQLYDDTNNQIPFLIEKGYGNYGIYGENTGETGFKTNTPDGMWHFYNGNSGVGSYENSDLIIEDNSGVNLGLFGTDSGGNGQCIQMGSGSDPSGASICWRLTTDALTLQTQNPNADIIFKSGNTVEAAQITDGKVFKIQEGFTSGTNYYSNTPPSGGGIIEGWVGRGTTSPDSEFENYGEFTLSYNESLSSTFKTTVDGNLQIDNDLGIYQYGYNDGLNSTFYFYDDNQLITAKIDTNGDSYILGDFSVGDSTPDARLHVDNGNSQVGSYENADAIIEDNGATVLGLFGFANSPQRIIYGTNNDPSSAYIDYQASSDAFTIATENPSDDIIFKTGNAVEAMKLDDGKILRIKEGLALGDYYANTPPSGGLIVSGDSAFGKATSVTGFQVYDKNITVGGSNGDVWMQLVSNDAGDATPSFVWTQDAVGRTWGHVAGVEQMRLEQITGNLIIQNNITANTYYGDGSQLTGITDTDTKWVTNKIYLYNGTTMIYFNESKLNATIDARDTNTDNIWTIINKYLYNNSGYLDMNETNLNNTIDARDDDTNYWNLTGNTIDSLGYNIHVEGNVTIFNGDLEVSGENRDHYMKLISDENADATPSYVWTQDAVGRTWGHEVEVEQMRLEQLTGNLIIQNNITANNIFVNQYIFAHTNETISLNTASEWVNITFGQEETSIMKGIQHSYQTNNHIFNITNTGYYYISYDYDVVDTSVGASDIDIGARLTYINSTEIKGSVFETGITKQGVEIELSHEFLAHFNTGDRIMFQFTADDADVEVSTHGTFGDYPESASIIVRRID